jgi:hypothetical protein
MLWQYLMTSYLEGQNLFGYIDGTTLCPPKFLPSASASTSTTPAQQILNPEYQIWYRQDKLILSVIISTLSEVILAHVVHLHTPCDVWNTLEKIFSS